MDDLASFGQRVRQLRTDAGLSMRVLGEQIHYSNAQISRIEHGRVPPSTEFAVACDRVFGTGDELTRASAALVLQSRRTEAAAIFDVPAAPRMLIGRDAELESVVRHLGADMDRRTARVCVLHGMGGAGKTAIALTAAERLRPIFPDGVMHLDMLGYNSHHERIEEAEALDRLLRRLGVPGELIPRPSEDRGSLLRQQLDGLRVLIVLDSVADAGQVARLLPPSGHSAMLITSRQSLTPLAATFRQHVTALEPPAAVELFTSVAELLPGMTDRGDPAMITEIAELCCKLPLALCIAASRFRDNPVRRLEDVAERLRDPSVRLRELDDGSRSISNVLAVSFATLSDTQQTMLGVIALHPGPRVDARAAAALSRMTVTQAEDVLDELIRSEMLEPHSVGAYRMHDLLRDYLLGPGDHALSASEGAAARRRLFLYFLHAVAAAESLIDEHRFRLPIEPYEPAIPVPAFPHADAARQWLHRESDNVLPLIAAMDVGGEDVICWQFAYYLRGFFYATKQWELMAACSRRALEPARRTGDPKAVAVTLNNLGLAFSQLDRKEEATDLYAQARAQFALANDPYGEANAVANHGWLAHEMGDHATAIELAKQAWHFYNDRERPYNAAIALDCIARCEKELDLLEDAERHFLQVARGFADLDLSQGDRAQVLSHIGETRLRLGRLDAAAESYEEAVRLARSGKALREEALAFEGLSRTTAARGRVVDADGHRAAALALYEKIGAAEDARRIRGEAAAAGNPQDAAEEPSHRALRILVINTEWSSRHGGLSTLNRELCRSMVSQGAEVYCSTPSASDEENEDAARARVSLVHPPTSSKYPDAVLTHPPELPPGVVPDVVIGHGRQTGEAARLVSRHYPGARLVHFFHVISDQVEFEKEHEPDIDPMDTAEQRFQEELEIVRNSDLAVGVGPVLHKYLRGRLRGPRHGKVRTHRLDPGFDIAEQALEPPDSGDDTAQVLLFGRLSVRESKVKGVDIAAAALGHVMRQRGTRGPDVELVLRGVEAGEGRRLKTTVEKWAGRPPSLRVQPRPYSADKNTLEDDLHQARVVVMPSRAEGFGLVGLEAVTAGIPVLISDRSGLGRLLLDAQSKLSVDLSNRVLPVTGDPLVDTVRWGDAIASILDHPKLAFRTAADLRAETARMWTWAAAAAEFLAAIKAQVDR
ncbi:helix-turn-helix domain-containing protein [Micromonospora zamorensis]|uniref:helix-turn-helix domain-containing protein n=1 Tax=Micromonospora zamorensis TaxID=709883 RepID=UPI002E202C07